MMTFVLFFGDLLVMAFMIGLGVWVLLGMSDAEADRIARIPLEEDDDDHG